MTAIPTIKRKPLWQKIAPVSKKDIRPASKLPPPLPTPPPGPGRGPSRAVYCIAEPELGFERRDFRRICEAAREFVSVNGKRSSATAISESIRTGCRAGGRYWWFLDRPISDRPALSRSNCVPMIVGGVRYECCREAADALHINYAYFMNRYKRGYVVEPITGEKLKVMTLVLSCDRSTTEVSNVEK